MLVGELLREIGRPVVVYPALIKLFGLTESLFLCQLIYWEGKQKDEKGWIYKSLDELNQETGLSRKQIRIVRASLKKLKVLEDRYDRQSHRLYYRLCLDQIQRRWEAFCRGHVPFGHVPKGQVPGAQRAGAQQLNGCSDDTCTGTEITHRVQKTKLTTKKRKKPVADAPDSSSLVLSPSATRGVPPGPPVNPQSSNAVKQYQMPERFKLEGNTIRDAKQDDPEQDQVEFFLQRWTRLYQKFWGVKPKIVSRDEETVLGFIQEVQPEGLFSYLALAVEAWAAPKEKQGTWYPYLISNRHSRTPTGFLNNSQKIAEELDWDHTDQQKARDVMAACGSSY